MEEVGFGTPILEQPVATQLSHHCGRLATTVIENDQVPAFAVLRCTFRFVPIALEAFVEAARLRSRRLAASCSVKIMRVIIDDGQPRIVPDTACSLPSRGTAISDTCSQRQTVSRIGQTDAPRTDLLVSARLREDHRYDRAFSVVGVTEWRR